MRVRFLRAEERRRARARHYAEMLVLVRGLARRYKNLVNRISKAEMNATFIEYELFQVLKMMEECVDEGADEFARDFAPGLVQEAQAKPQKPLRYLAESGTSSLEIKARPDGMADIRIDGGKQFTLPPALADLMTALSIDNGLSDDAQKLLSGQTGCAAISRQVGEVLLPASGRLKPEHRSG